MLKKIPLNKARKPDKFLDSQYYPVSQSAFGVYRLSNGKQTKIINPEKESIKFSQLSDLDLFATNQAQIDTYYKFKEQIFKALDI